MRSLIVLLVLLLSACSTKYPNENPISQTFPSVKGNTLEEQPVSIPEQFNGETVLLLIGYKQNSQFDIDRWLIGLDMTETDVPVFEIPTINNWFAQLISNQIDNGMRKGIPSELWKIVITVYEDGGIIQRFTGNENPNNTRVVLLNGEGKVVYFYDKGFSVAALNDLRNALEKQQSRIP
jgi:hypothetical protein